VVTCDTRYLRDTRETVTPLGVENSAAKVLGKDTIVVTARGTVGEVRMLGESMAFNQTCYGLVANQGVDPAYLYYTLKASMRQMRALSYGTVFDTITMKTFDALMVPYPSLPEQRAIASILGALDDKIELNRQMNQAFEEMAQAIFKNWFVDFEPFREEGMQDSPLGPIPKGWTGSQLGDFVSLDKGVSYKGRFLSDDGFPMINLGCLLGGGRFSSRNLKYYSGDYRERHVVYPGDIVIANTDITQKREVLGSPAIVPPSEEDRRYLFSHHVYALRFRRDQENWKRFVFFSLLQQSFRDRAIGFATGTTVLALPRDAVLGYQFPNPGDSVIRAFTQEVDPMLRQSYANDRQSQTLSAIRDALLPKLLSGKIRVKDAEKFVEGGL